MNMIPCRECALPIPISARKCSHCDAYQDWRRYISRSTETLSLLVALVSVSGLTIPSIITSMSARPQLIGYIEGNSPPTVRIANLGNRPALIQREATLMIQTNNIGLLRIFISSSKEGFLINPMTDLSFSVNRNNEGKPQYFISSISSFTKDVGTSDVVTINYSESPGVLRSIGIKCTVTLTEV